ncbi:MAG: helix-turn-helix domain-containing protein [Ectothiorhodospiraceae bacterium]|nr:helix-turn-helix domain-containing protein [Ectothiorhodospiraceae bacterium]MCH8506169.1 helix-turn-helix domain-containing protein [Ectothiorhodospiraceae bacterium]
MVYAPVAALLKGLRVLESVNRIGPATLKQIQADVDLPKASTLRLLETLCHDGYVVAVPEKHQYMVTARVLGLSNNYRPDEALLAAARPIMEELRSETGWPSDMAIYQGGKMVIMDTSRQPGMLSVNRSVGARVPVMATAVGRAYLAFCPDDERERILADLSRDRDPAEAPARNPAAVQQLIEETRERGYALSNQEYVRTIRAAGIPVMRDGAVVCAFNIIALAQAVPLEQLRDHYVPLLMQARNRIENAISP